MKKIISLLLVTAMLLLSLLTFTSCGDAVTAKIVEENAYAAIDSALSKSIDRFIGSEEVLNVLDDMANANGITATYKDEDGAFSPIKQAEIFFAGKNDNAATVLSVMLGDTALSANVFTSKEGIIVSGEDVVGSDKALMIKYASLDSGLKDSALVKMFGISPEMIDTFLLEFGPTIDTISGKGEKTVDVEKLTNDLLDTMNIAVSEEEVDGAKAIVITITVTPDTVKAALDIISAEVKKLVPDQAEGIDESFAGFKTAVEESEINVTAKTYINAKEGYLMSSSASGNAKDSDEGESFEINVSTKFSESEISLLMSTVEDGESTSLSLKTTREFKDGILNFVTDYTMDHAGHDDEESVNPITAKLSYNTQSGAIELSATIRPSKNQADDIQIALGATFQKEGTKSTLKISSVKYDKVTIELDISLTFDTNATVPSAPTNALDIVAVTEEQLGEILTKFQSSKLFEIIGQFTDKIQ